MKENIQAGAIRLFYLFLTGCIVGWLYEVILGFIYGYGFVNRGFLYGPYLPIYGFGLVILTLALGKLMKTPIRAGGINVAPVFVFLGIVAITTLIEYAAGLVLLEKFGMRLWDYSTYWMNLNGIISFNTSIRFGIGGMFLLYGLVPLTDRIIGKMTIKTRKTAMLAITGIMLADLAATLLFR